MSTNMMVPPPNQGVIDKELQYNYHTQQILISKHDCFVLSTYPPTEHSEITWKHILLNSSTSVLHRFVTITKWVLNFLLPSFLSQRLESQDKYLGQRSTAWLDGLRGVASFFVFIYHYIYAYCPQHEFGYDGAFHTNLIQLPILRLLYAGPAMVKIFFVISGFALAWKPMKLLKGPASNRNEKLLNVLSSSILRRYPRLYLPILARSTIVALLVHTGACQWIDHARKLDREVLPGHYEYHPLKTNYIMEQMANMWSEFSVYGFDKILYNSKHYGYYTDVSFFIILIKIYTKPH